MSTHRVEVRERRLVGAPYTVRYLVVDGEVLRAQLSPFDLVDLEAWERTGAPPVTAVTTAPRGGGRGAPRRRAS